MTDYSKITALYSRLSVGDEDRDGGESNNASKEEYVDMKKAGIVDPTKVTRSALQNAASIASMVITTESLVTDIPEKDCHCGHEGGMGAAGIDGMY